MERLKVNGPPGTGKTRFLIDICEREMERGRLPHEIIFCSFTRAAAAEARDRAMARFGGSSTDYPWFATEHSICFRLLGLSRNLVFTKRHLRDFGKRYRYDFTGDEDEKDNLDRRYHEGMLKSVADHYEFFLGYMRNRMLPFNTAYREFLRSVGYETPDGFTRSGLELYIERREQYKQEHKLWSFDDMISEALNQRLCPPEAKVLILDECLPFHTPILLANGESREVGEIVEKRLPVQVLTYNLETGKQEPKSILAYRKIPLRKPVIKVSATWWMRLGQGKKWKVRSFIVCTEDHLVFTPQGYRPARDLRPGDHVQIETSAPRTQKYKITTKGRKTLSETMLWKNVFRLEPLPGGVITVRGGNGKGLTEPQRILLEALGSGWVPEYVQSLGGRVSGYPTHYKIDLAHPSRRLAIEIDGESHKAKYRQYQDKKKQAKLESLGWTVYRVSNKEAVCQSDTLAANINLDCPKWVRVARVEPASIPDNYVYDLTIADNHNFYANGFLVHNCQDSSPLLWELIKFWASQVESYYIAGDPLQTLYFWAGSSPELFYNFPGEEQVLSHSYRLTPEVKDFAQKIIERTTLPFPEYSPSDRHGEIARQPFMGVDWENAGECFVLARTRWLISHLTGHFLAKGIPFTSERGKHSPLGTTKGRAFYTLVKLAEGERVSEFELANLVKHTGPPFLKRGAKTKVRNLVEGRYGMRDLADMGFTPVFTKAMSNGFESVLRKDIEDFERAYLLRVLSRGGRQAFEQESKIVVTTIHGSKGREKPVVYLCPDLTRKVWDGYAQDRTSETLVSYVGVTRAIDTLVLLTPTQRYSFPYPRIDKRG